MKTAVRRLANFVNGEYVAAAQGGTRELIDPSTGDVFAEAPKFGARGRRQGILCGLGGVSRMA